MVEYYRCTDILSQLSKLGKKENLSGMARFGINTEKAYGVSIPDLRKLAGKIGKNHPLAQELWDSGYHEARILAGMIDDPLQVNDVQMEKWVFDFNSWDLCDQCCNNLFVNTAFAHQKAMKWSKREQEFVKRAGFVLMATLAVHDKKSSDDAFLKFLPVIAREAGDSRNFVKKAVNWALRQIGKRNRSLNKEAIQFAKKIETMQSSSARWIARDALSELTSTKISKKLET